MMKLIRTEFLEPFVNNWQEIYDKLLETCKNDKAGFPATIEYITEIPIGRETLIGFALYDTSGAIKKFCRSYNKKDYWFNLYETDGEFHMKPRKDLSFFKMALFEQAAGYFCCKMYVHLRDAKEDLALAKAKEFLKTSLEYNHYQAIDDIYSDFFVKKLGDAKTPFKDSSIILENFKKLCELIPYHWAAGYLLLAQYCINISLYYLEIEKNETNKQYYAKRAYVFLSLANLLQSNKHSKIAEYNAYYGRSILEFLNEGAVKGTQKIYKSWNDAYSHCATTLNLNTIEQNIAITEAQNIAAKFLRSFP